MKSPLFDTHCHFDASEFDSSRNDIWQHCVRLGVKQLLIPGVAPRQWPKLAQLTAQYDGFFMAAGLHPWWVGEHYLPEMHIWSQQLANPACIAIGECGLDAWIDTPLSQQCPVFERHLQVAVDFAMPVIIHVRKTHNETIRLLKQYRLKSGGVIHGFTGSIELAQAYWALGFRLGIGGSITYPRANKTRETVKYMPLEALLLETDAPDMPLNGFQGQPNSPVMLPMIAESLATLRQEQLELIASVTTDNAKQLFSL